MHVQQAQQRFGGDPENEALGGVRETLEEGLGAS